MRNFHCECGGGSHGSEKGDAAHGGFLHEFETGPTAHQYHMVMQGKMIVYQCPPKDFIQGIVPPDIFPQTKESALFIKQA